MKAFRSFSVPFLRCFMWGIVLISMASSKGISYIDSEIEEVSSDQTCLSDLEAMRHQILQDLNRLEWHYIKMKWQYWKYREIVYFPLWTAAMQKKNTFSKNEQVEGEKDYARYRHWADVYLSEAESEALDMWGAFQHVKDVVEEIEEMCVAWDFRDCVGFWRDPLMAKAEELEKLMKSYEKKEKMLSVQVEATMNESPSEHHDFKERYYEPITEWNYQFYPNFMRLIREIRGEVEWNWVGNRCCDKCIEEAIRNADHPLLGDRERKRVSERRGIGGKALNKNDLVKAFEEFELAEGKVIIEDEKKIEVLETPSQEAAVSQESLKENLESLDYVSQDG